jgi:hypothetical protein
LRKLIQSGDDGSLSVTQYDADGARPWATYTSTFGNSGQLTGLNVSYDNGTSLITQYDASDIAAWSSQTGAGGAGIQSFNIVDAGDAFEWAAYTNVVDGSGRLLSQAGTLDNGGHWLNAYDTGGAFTWSSYFNAYDPNGQLIWQSGTQDNGTHWLTTFDPSGVNSWSMATVAFDAEWNMMALGGVNDDGSHLIAAGEFNQAYDTLGWSPFAYVPTQHLWPQPQIWGGTVAENATAGTVVGTVAGAPGDGGTILNFALTNSANGKFAIDAATRVVTVVHGAQFDYESASSQTISVRTTDASGEVLDKTFTIAVTNVNEAPTGATMTGGTVAENAANGTAVGTVAGIDPDFGSTFGYALTNNAGGRFAINATTGVVTVANGASLDYEAAQSQTITVRVTDQGGLTFDKNFIIGVTNVNEAPTNATMTGGTVTENSAGGTVVGTVAGTDPDAGATFSYALTNSAGNRFAINATTGVVTVANGAVLDYETAASQTITVRITDQGGLTLDKNFTIGVTNVNEAPTNATMTGGSVAKNSLAGTAVGTVAGVDQDSGSTLTYAFTNNPANRFAINATTGAITVAAGAALNYEAATSHAITVRVTDQGGLTFDKNFTIGVTNVNEAPTNVTLSNASVMEHSASHTDVGILTGVDPDAGAILTYTLTNNAGGLFQLNPTANNLLETAGNWWALDYATATSHTVTVRATDQGGLSYTTSFNIAVTPDHVTHTKWKRDVDHHDL